MVSGFISVTYNLKKAVQCQAIVDLISVVYTAYVCRFKRKNGEWNGPYASATRDPNLCTLKRHLHDWSFFFFPLRLLPEFLDQRCQLLLEVHASPALQSQMSQDFNLPEERDFVMSCKRHNLYEADTFKTEDKLQYLSARDQWDIDKSPGTNEMRVP